MIRLKPPYKDANEEFKARYILRRLNTLRLAPILFAFMLGIVGVEAIVDHYKNADAEPDQTITLMEGEYLTFGMYEQDNNTENGKESIEWLVLEEKDGKVFVVSKYVLDVKAFSEAEDEGTAITWDTCTLRKWLNDEFFNTAFTESEKNKILTTDVVVNDDSSDIFEFYVNPGQNTQDKVFLLNKQEVNSYFVSDEARVCKATAFVTENNLMEFNRATGNDYGTCEWWICVPGQKHGEVTTVSDDGHMSGTCNVLNGCGIRPAMWINLQTE